MAQNLGGVQFSTDDWPDLTASYRVTVPADWVLGPASATALRDYDGQVLDVSGPLVRITEGALKDVVLSGGRLQIFDREWPSFIPDTFYLRDVDLSGPDALTFSSGDLGDLGSLELSLSKPSGQCLYLTNLPGINSGTSAATAIREQADRKLQVALTPYITTAKDGSTLIDPAAFNDPKVKEAIQEFNDAPKSSGLQGLFSLASNTVSFKLFDNLSFTATGSDQQPGFRADYSLDYDPFQEPGHLLDNRSYISLDNVRTSLSIAGIPIYELFSRSEPDQPDLVLRGGDWGLKPSDDVLRIESLQGNLQLLPWTLASGEIVYPKLEISGLEIHRDETVSVEAIRVDSPQGAISSLGLAGIIHFELRSLGVDFERKSNGSLDLQRPSFTAVGSVDRNLLEQQLRDLTDSPALTLGLQQWSPMEGKAIPLEQDQELTLSLLLDATKGSLLVKNAPPLLLQITNLVLPLPGGEQPLFSGSLILCGTDDQGQPLPIPAGLLTDAGVLTPLPPDLENPQALLAGQISSADGSNQVAALIGGSLQDLPGGSRLLLNGQVRLDGDIVGAGLSLGGTVEAPVRWQLDALRDGAGGLKLSGFPTVEGIGIQTLQFSVDGVLRLRLDHLAWTRQPLLDEVTGSPGLVARARGLTLEVLAGALAGNSFQNDGAEVLLFDLEGSDGIPDHFHVDGVQLGLENARLGPVSATGLQLELEQLTNLPLTPGGPDGWRGTIRLEADQALLQVGESFRGEILPATPAEGAPARPGSPALEGRLDLANGDLSLQLRRLEAALSFGGKPVITLAAAPDADQPALTLELKADGDANAQVLSLPTLMGQLPLLAVQNFSGQISPALEVSGFALQRDGDVELDSVDLTLPEGLLRQLNLDGLVPFDLRRLRLSFPSRGDGSVNLDEPRFELSGQLNITLLQNSLRQLVDAPELSLQVALYGPDGVLQAVDDSTVLNLDARINDAGALELINSPGWQVQLSGVPLPVPAESRPVLAGTLLLPGTDAGGAWLPLPSSRITDLVSLAGSQQDPASLIALNPRVMGLLRGSLQAPDASSTDLFVGGDGTLLVAGTLQNDTEGGSRLELQGEALLSPLLSFPGLATSADLSASFAWTLLSRPQKDGSIDLSGSPRLSGARVENLSFRVDDVLELGIDALSWSATPEFDRVAGKLTPGLIARGEGLNLQLLAGPLGGLKLGSPDIQVRLYDLEANDGLADHFFLDGQVLNLDHPSLGWLEAERLSLSSHQVSDLPVLDSSPGDEASLSGRLDLDLLNARIGAGLNFSRAAGTYDLAAGSLLLSLEGLQFQDGALQVTGAGRLQIDPDAPSDAWLRLQSRGTVDPGLAGLPALQGNVELTWDRDLTLSAIHGQLTAAAGSGWLGDLQLNSDLSFSYDAALNQVELEGSVALAGVTADAMIRFEPGEEGFEASLKLNNQNRLQLADWLTLQPKQLDLLYSYAPESGGRLALNGSAALSLNDYSLNVSADLAVAFDARTHQSRIEAGSLKLTDPLQAIDIDGFRVELVADQSGQLPSISVVNKEGSLLPRLSGAVRLPDLGGLTVNLDPTQDSISYSSTEGWNFEAFRVDLTPSGPLDLGLLQLGDGAYLSYGDGSFTIDPELSINANLMGQVISPVAAAIDNTITPLTSPVVTLLKQEIDLSVLNNIQKYKPSWVWSWTWDPVADAGRNLYEAMLSLFENTPGNAYKDGKLQVVELIDSFNYAFYKLIQKNPTTARALAEQFGLPASYVDAAIQGMRYVSLSSTVAVLEAFHDLAKAVKLAGTDPTSADNGGFTAVPGLAFQFRPGGLEETLGSITAVASEASPILRAILAVQAAWEASNNAAAANVVGSNPALVEAAAPADSNGALFSASADLAIPLLDDPLNAVISLLKGDNIDLLEVVLGLQANLSFSYDQTVPVPVGPLILPLTLGAQASLKGEMNAVLGLSTNAEALKTFSSDINLDGLLPAIGGLLAPPSGEDYGLYLSGVDDRPLLSLSPAIRIQAGLDAVAAGIRTFVGVGGSLDVTLAKERVYLGSLLQLLTGSTPPNPTELGQLFGLDADLQASFGLDAKLLNWSNLATAKIPIYSLSVPRVSLGPVVNGEVLLDLRSYNDAGELITNLNLVRDPGESLSHTDERGSYLLSENPDPDEVGNRDGILDYRDGMVLAGNRDANGAIQLLDSISGVDLGIPLVGLPNGNINLLTTIKYTSLLRWNPDRTLGGQPLSPERISEVFAPLVKDAPAAFLNDNYEAYKALASPDPKEVEVGLSTLSFSYQHLAAVRTIIEIFRDFKLDYSLRQGWEYPPDADGVDAPEVVGFAAYGRAIRSLFGTANQDGENPLDPYRRPPLAAQFDVENPTHLRAVLAEILAQYPTQAFGDVAGSQLMQTAFLARGRTQDQQQQVNDAVEQQFGGFLSNTALGLSEIVSAVSSRLHSIQELDALIPTAGSQLLAPAIAGPKRLVLTTLIPELVQIAQHTDARAFSKQFAALFATPTTVDAADRLGSFQIHASLSGSAAQSLLQLDAANPADRVVVTVSLTDQQGKPVVAPDYGLSVRYRLGGTAIAGVDYNLAEQSRVQIAFVPPGASSTNLVLSLQPSFYQKQSALLQLQLLSADSGYEVAAQDAVVSVRSGSEISQMRNELPQSSSFEPSQLIAALEDGKIPLIASQTTANVVLRGIDGQADTFVLRPGLQTLPHIENFDLDEGDRLLIDERSLQIFRATPEARRHSQQAEEQAFHELESQLGLDAVQQLTPEQRQQRLLPILESLEPLPAAELSQFNTYGGFLFDMVSGQPLALLSDRGVHGNDQPWSALSPTLYSGWMDLLPASVGSTPLLRSRRQTLSGDRLQLAQVGSTPDLQTAERQQVQLSATALSLRLLLEPGLKQEIVSSRLSDFSPDLSRSRLAGSSKTRRYLMAYAFNQEGHQQVLGQSSDLAEAVRFYDRNGDSIPDFLSMTLLDGAASDSDQSADGSITTTVTVATVALSPLLQQGAAGAVTVGDPNNLTAPANLRLKASVDRRGSSANQIGYVLLNPSEADAGSPALANLEELRSRAKIVLSTLGAKAVQPPSQKTFSALIDLHNGDSVRFFAIKDGDLSDLTSLNDPRLRFLDGEQLTGRKASFSTEDGSRFHISLAPGVAGLNGLIAQQQASAPLLDFSGFAASEQVRGTLKLSRESTPDSITGFYRVLDTEGTVRDALGNLYHPGDANYQDVALSEDNVVHRLSSLEAKDNQISTQKLRLSESSLLAPFAQLSDQSVIHTYFAYPEASSDGSSYFKTLGTNTFGLETQWNESNKGSDNLILKFHFTGVRT